MKTILDDHGIAVTEARLLPYSADGNLVVGIQSYHEEIKFRKERNKKLGAKEQFPIPRWLDLKIYFKNGQIQ